jgi:hypothetical protein
MESTTEIEWLGDTRERLIERAKARKSGETMKVFPTWVKDFFKKSPKRFLKFLRI